MRRLQAAGHTSKKADVVDVVSTGSRAASAGIPVGLWVLRAHRQGENEFVLRSQRAPAHVTKVGRALTVPMQIEDQWR